MTTSRTNDLDRTVVGSIVVGLLGSIVDARLTAGTRLPSERQLALDLGTSRVSVRSALGCLSEWSVIMTRHGSGATVLPMRSWTAGAMGGVIRHLMATHQYDRLTGLVADGIALRRAVVLDLIERAAPHLDEHRVGEARELVRRAWQRRADRQAFVALDAQVLPALLDAAAMHPSLWLVNSLASPYLAVMAALAPRVSAPEAYLEAHEALFAALAKKRAQRARRIMAAHLETIDRRIVRGLPAALRLRLTKKEKTWR